MAIIVVPVVVVVALVVLVARILIATPALDSQVVASPGPGMVATAIGDGGAQPTTVLPGGQGLTGSGQIPTTPTIYLEPVTKQGFGGVQTKQAAYWKVWWDADTHTKAVVALQQHVNSSSAAAEQSRLAQKNSDPASFSTFSQYNITVSSVFSVPGVPNSAGYVWDWTASDGVKIEFRFASFSKGSVLALVSLTAYNAPADQAALDSFAQAEYAEMR